MQNFNTRAYFDINNEYTVHIKIVEKNGVSPVSIRTLIQYIIVRNIEDISCAWDACIENIVITILSLAESVITTEYALITAYPFETTLSPALPTSHRPRNSMQQYRMFTRYRIPISGPAFDSSLANLQM